MASKGLRAISYQVIREVEKRYNPSHTTETLIGYTGDVYETLGRCGLRTYQPTQAPMRGRTLDLTI